MSRKRDIKQFRQACKPASLQACKEAGLTAQECYEASEALNAEKKSGSVQDAMSYGQLLAWLREWKR